MKATLTKDGNLQIDMRELVESFDDGHRAMFAEHAVFETKLMEAVCDTVVSGECFDGWYISDLANRLRLKLMPLMPEVMVSLIKSLLTDQARRTAAVKEHENLLFVLLAQWPEKIKCPTDRSWVNPDYTTISRKDAEEFIAKRLGAEWEAIKARHAANQPEAVA